MKHTCPRRTYPDIQEGFQARKEMVRFACPTVKMAALTTRPSERTTRYWLLRIHKKKNVFLVRYPGLLPSTWIICPPCDFGSTGTGPYFLRKFSIYFQHVFPQKLHRRLPAQSFVCVHKVEVPLLALLYTWGYCILFSCRSKYQGEDAVGGPPSKTRTPPPEAVSSALQSDGGRLPSSTL